MSWYEARNLAGQRARGGIVTRSRARKRSRLRAHAQKAALHPQPALDKSTVKLSVLPSTFHSFWVAVNVLDVGAAQPLVITAANQDAANVYVTGATWNGAAISGVYVAYSDLMQGGTLEFTMAAAPTAAGAAVMPPFA